jgi:hypothetical protein
MCSEQHAHSTLKKTGYSTKVHAEHTSLHLLPDEVGDGLGEDAVHVLLGQALERDPDGQAPLQLGQQVRRLGCGG